MRNMIKKFCECLKMNKRWKKWIFYTVIAVICYMFLFVNSEDIFSDRSNQFDTITAYQISNETVLKQRMDGFGDNLKAISIRFATYARVNRGTIKLELLEDDTCIYEWNLDTTELVDNEYHKFELDKRYNRKPDCQYSFVISGEYEKEDSAVAVWLSSGGDQLEPLNGFSICYQMTSIDEKGLLVFRWLTLAGYLLFAAMVTYGNKDTRLNGVNALFFVGIVFVVTQAVTVELLAKIQKEVTIVNYETSAQEDVITPGEAKYYGLPAKQCVFDTVEIFVAQEQGMNVSLEMMDAYGQQIYYAKTYGEESIGICSKNQKSVIKIQGNKFPKGDYSVRITNNGEKDFAVSVLGDKEHVLNVCLIKNSNLGIYIALFLIVIVAIYLFAIWATCQNGRLDIYKFFLITSVSMTMLYFVLMLPWSGPDAGAHYGATYRLSNMVLGYPEEKEWWGREEDAQFSKQLWGDSLNPSMQSYVDVVYNFKIFSSDNTIVEMPFREEKMEYYSIINYWPEVLGLTLGRFLNFSAIFNAYLARLFLCIFYVSMCYHALKVTPIAKSLFAGISLLPMPLMMSSAFSYDPMVIITSLCFVASIFALYKEPDSIKKLVEACIWSFMLGSVKGGGSLILLPLVFIIVDSVKNKKIWIKIGCISASGVFSVLFFNKILQIGNELFQFGIEGNGKMEASFAYQHPLQYVQMCVSTYLSWFNRLLLNMIGTELAWLEKTLPDAIMLLLVFTICILAIYEKDEIILRKRDRDICFFSAFLMIAFTPMMLLSWTNKGATVIDGLQGRYYFPVFILVLIGLCKYSLHIVKNNDYSAEIIAVQNKCMKTFSVLSCISVFYIGQLYLTR